MFSADDMLLVKTIGDSGSLTAAADALNTSQPALSRTLRNLEARIGAPLFRRLPRGITPTDCGKTLLLHADEVQAIARAARVEVEAHVRNIAPRLRLGIAPYVALAPVTRAITAMEIDHPNLRFEIRVGPPLDLTAALSDGDLDLVIGPLGGGDAHLKETALFDDNAAIMVRRDHPIRGTQPLLSDLDDYRWILPHPGHPLRRRIEALFLDAECPRPAVYIETEDIPLTFNLALRSDFLVAIPRDVALFAARDQEIRILDVELSSDVSSIGITQLRARRLPIEAAALIEAMVRELEGAGL